MQNMFDTTIGDMYMFKSPEEQARIDARKKYETKRAKVEERDKYNEFMRRRREKLMAGRL